MSGILAIFREALLIFYPNNTQQQSVFWSCVLIAFIISAAILLFQQRKVINTITKELDEEKENKRPKLTAEFNVFAVAPAGKLNEDSIVSLTATITNVGAPSIISHVELILKKEGREIKGENIVLSSGPIVFEGNDIKLQVRQEDNLTRQGISHPIPTRGALHGWHVVLFRNIKREEIYSPTTTVIFRFKDVTGALYTTETPMDSTASDFIDASKLQNT
ncbi:MAG: hypothetical protein K4571_00200 [Deltaproteobacteria bacterium]